ncbi:MAG: hypothetical protein DRI48_09910 [Chloroflexi bacterium]|nr:MAG: hypothetical protein DRI48_09910 [Chloroflexota bacterium]
MLTLIRREIEDNIVHFVVAALLSALLVFALWLMWSEQLPNNDPLEMLTIFVLLVVLVRLCRMGQLHICAETSRNALVFLCTLPVTRTQLLAAKVITATLVILTFGLPPLFALRFFAYSQPSFGPCLGFERYVWDLTFTLFLLLVGSYCSGLLSGFNSSRTIRAFGTFVLPLVLALLVLAKGFSLQTYLILVLFIFAVLLHVRHRFAAISL